MNSLVEAWKRCCARLRAELGEDIFTSWFGRLELETAADGRACFTVPTRFLKSWIESHYVDRILAALNSEIGGIADLTIAVRSSTRGPACGASPAPTHDSLREPRPAEYSAAPLQEAAAGSRGIAPR
jgi:chromosomal replication initiator protein